MSIRTTGTSQRVFLGSVSDFRKDRTLNNTPHTESLVPDLHPGMEANLFDFVFHCTEDDSPGVNTFTAGNFQVEWHRSVYSGDREGLDHFVATSSGKEIANEPMFRDVDDDALARIAALYAPGMGAEQIIGMVS